LESPLSLRFASFLSVPYSPSHSNTERVDDDVEEVVGNEDEVVDEETTRNLPKSFDNEYVNCI
jgi:hypothetical protein